MCFAEALLLKALLTFIEDETLVSFIRAGIKIRSCFNSYKYVLYNSRFILRKFVEKKITGLFIFRECNVILNSRTWSENEKNYKEHFESGVRLGIGAFNLVCKQHTYILAKWSPRQINCIHNNCKLTSVFRPIYIDDFTTPVENNQTTRIHWVFWKQSKHILKTQHRAL